MAKVLKCNDLLPGCPFEARGNSVAEVLKAAAGHLKAAHNLKEIPPELQSKVRIRDEGKVRAQEAG